MTNEELLAHWNKTKNTSAAAPSANEDMNALMRKQWADREAVKKRNGPETFVNSMMNAIGDTGTGIAQALGQEDPAAVKRMQDRRVNDTATNAGRLGNVIGATIIPTAVTAGLTGGMSALPLLKNAYATRNAVGSAVGGAIIPTMEGESNLKNALVSGAIGGGPAIAKRLFAQPIKPTAEAQLLIDNGIYPTPGQASGLLNPAESATTSMPFFGTAIGNARTQPFKEYVARRQKTFGYEGKKLGREATEEMGDISDEQYRNVIPKLHVEITPELRSKYLRNVQLTPPSEQDAMRSLIQYELDPKLANSKANLLVGEDLNDWQSMLRKQGQRHAGSGGSHQQNLGEGMLKSREDTLNAIEEQGLVPTGVADEFANARKYYAGMKDLMSLGESGAAAKRGGVFTPGEDINWMKRNYGGKDSNMFGRNQVEDQRLAQAAENTLGAMPDTGTAGRLSMLSFMRNPELGNIEKAIGLAGLPFATQPARKFAVGGYDWQRALANGLRNTEDMSFPLLAPFTTEVKNESNR